MKKFFRALALVLALALVIGVVPATAASAKVKANKKLYVGGAQGKSADGKLTSSIKNKVAIYKLAGYTKATKEGHKFKAEVQKDNGVVKIKGSYVIAQKLGKALVDIYVDGEKVGTTTINSKINATEDTLQLLCNGEAMPEEFVVAGKYTFTLPRVGKDSDERRLYINGELVADDKDAPRTYTHTFTKSEEGEVVFKFEAYQDAKLDGALVSKEYKAKVVPPKATGAKQTAWNAFEVTFDSNVEAGGYYSDLKAWETEQDGVANDVYYKVNGIKIPFSSVKTSKPKENTLQVTMFGSFVPKTEYFVDIAGKTFSFVAAGNEAKDVTDLVVVTTTATVGTTTDIKVKLLNSAGIDITDTAKEGQSLTFSGTPTSTSDYLDPLGTVYFAAVGDSVDVTATFTFYDPDDNYTAKPTSGKGTIVGVAAAATNLVYSEYSISKAAEGYNNSGAGVHTLKMNDDAVLYGKIKLKTGDTENEYKIGDAMPEFGNATLQVKVADEHYAMAEGASGDGGENLEGVHQGRTSILVYYVNDKGNAVVLTTWAIEVVAARVPSSISAVAKNTTINTPYLNDDTTVGDALNIKVTLLDQYGDKIAKTVYLDQRLTSAEDAGVQTSFTGASNANISVTQGAFTAHGTATTEKTVSYTVTVAGSNLTTAVSFKVKAAGSANVTKLVPVISATSVDTTLRTDRDWSGSNGDVAVKLVKMVDNTYYGGMENYALIKDAPTATVAKSTYLITGTGSAIYARVTRNNDSLATGVAGGINTSKTVRQNTYHVVNLADSIALTGGNTLTFQVVEDTNNEKLAAGTYQVAFFKVTGKNTTDTTCTVVPLGTVGFTASDAQAAPSIKQLAQTTQLTIRTDTPANTTTDVLAIVNSCYEFKWNGKVYTATDVDFKQNGAQLYIYSVAIAVNGAGADNNLYSYDAEIEDYEIPATIGELITLVP